MNIKADANRTPLLFLMNAGSGHNDAAVTREAIEEALKNEGRTYRISVIEDPNKIDEIARQTVEADKAYAENVISFGFKRLVVKPSTLYRSRRVKTAVDGEMVWMTAPLEFRVSPEPLLLMKSSAHATLEDRAGERLS
jgi:diacylglycerol kinase family enzyme